MKSDAKRSVLWSGIQNIANQGIHFIITVIIARLLTPEDYGLIAMLSIFFALAQAFIDSGLSGALIQKKNCTEKDYNSVFVFSIVVSSVLYMILFICAPLIAKLYDNEMLVALSRVYLFSLVINAVGVVPMTILHKNLQFKAFAFISTSINIFAGIVAIIAAYCGLAYWALVLQIIMTSVLSTIAYYVKTRWKPSFRFSVESFKSMISYGFPVMLTSIVHAIYNNLYSLVIGAKYNSRELGLYNRAYSFSSIVPTTFSNFTMRAMFPVLSKIQDNVVELKNKVIEMLHLSLYVVVPINVYLVFNCKDVIRIILGEKWMALVPYLVILCISSIAYVYTNLHMTIFKTIGRTRNLFVSETIRKVLGLFVIVITSPHGVKFMVYGLLVYSVVDVLISSAFLNHSLPVDIVSQVKASATPVFFSLVAGGLCFFLSLIISNMYARFLVSIMVFAGTYALLSVIFKERGIFFLKNFFK